MSLKYDEKTMKLKVRDNAQIMNIKTGNFLSASDVDVVDVNGTKFLRSIYVPDKQKPNKHWELDNWVVLTEKERRQIIIPEIGNDKHAITISDMKIIAGMDAVNILLILYLKDQLGEDGSIITREQRKVKNILTFIRDKPEQPLSWKHIENLLGYISRTKEHFLQWMGSEEGRLGFSNYIKI